MALDVTRRTEPTYFPAAPAAAAATVDSPAAAEPVAEKLPELRLAAWAERPQDPAKIAEAAAAADVARAPVRGVGAPGVPTSAASSGDAEPLSRDFGRRKSAGIGSERVLLASNDAPTPNRATDAVTPMVDSTEARDKRIGDEIKKKTGRDAKDVQAELMAKGYGPVDLPRTREILIQSHVMTDGPMPRDRPDPRAKPQLVMDEVLEPHPYNADRNVSRARIGTEENIQAMKDQGQHDNAMRAASGVAMGGAAVKGSASQSIVIPRAGAAYGPARSYTPSTGPSKAPPLPYAGLMPTAPGALADMKGRQAELHVAKETGGTLARDPKSPDKDLKVDFTRPNGQKGTAEVDVRGKNGELIAVGGPAKAQNLPVLTQRMTDLKLAAEAQKPPVKAQAYFSSDTPNEALNAARKVLGNDNVHTFARPELKKP